MSVISNALDFVMESNVFMSHLNNYHLRPDAVNAVSIKHYGSQTIGHGFKIYFDYGLEGESDKDFIVDVQIIDENTFEIL